MRRLLSALSFSLLIGGCYNGIDRDPPELRPVADSTSRTVRDVPTDTIPAP